MADSVDPLTVDRLIRRRAAACLLALLLAAAPVAAQNPLSAVFPDAVVTDDEMLCWSDLPETTLAEAIDAATLTIPVADGSGFCAPSTVRIGGELIKICAATAGELTACAGGRGFDGTAAASHFGGVEVKGYVAAYWFNRAAVEIRAIQEALGAGLGNVAAAGHGHVEADISDLAHFSGAYGDLSGVPSTFAPSAHASSHQHAGGDEIATATPGANAIPKAGAGGLLADGWIGETGVTQHEAALDIAHSQVTFSGLTSGHVWRATGAAAASFGALPIGDTTGDLAASRVDDGGAATTHALFSGAAGAAGFRAIVEADISDLAHFSGSWNDLTDKPSTFAPSAHAGSHQHGGGDEIATATPGANAIPKAGAGGLLADGWIGESAVTQHQGALSIAAPQLTGDIDPERMEANWGAAASVVDSSNNCVVYWNGSQLACLTGWPTGVTLSASGETRLTVGAIRSGLNRWQLSSIDGNLSFGSAGCVRWTEGGTFAGDRRVLLCSDQSGRLAITDINDTPGGLLLGSLELGDLRVYDPTASTGVTDAFFRAGAAQGSTPLTRWLDNSENVLASIGADGGADFPSYSVGGAPLAAGNLDDVTITAIDQHDILVGDSGGQLVDTPIRTAITASGLTHSRVPYSWTGQLTDKSTLHFDQDTNTLTSTVMNAVNGFTVGGSALGSRHLADVQDIAPSDGNCLVYDGVTDNRWEPTACPGGGGGEANTASNVGTAGVGVFKQKASVDLEFYKLNSTNNLLTIALDGTDKIDFTVNEANLSLTQSQISDVTLAGSTTELATVSGTKTTNKQLAFDASGNIIASGSDIGGGGGGASSLDDLSDVTLTTEGAGDFLRHNGSAWVNTTIQAGDLPSHSHTEADISDLAHFSGAYGDLSGVPSTFAPSAHASSHQHAGGDEIATATPGANAIPKAGAGGLLADGWIGETGVTQHEAALDIAHSQVTFSGLTAGHVWRATGAAAASFGALPIGDTTGDLAASRVDDGGAATTHALFSGAAGAAGFRAIVEADISDLAHFSGAYGDLSGVPSTFAPSAHASSHQHAGGDEIATATPGANAIPKAGAGGMLADGWIGETGVTQHEAALDIAHSQVTFSALTAGHVWRATGATTAAFGAIQSADLPATIGADTTGNAATASGAQSTPSLCPEGQAARGVDGSFDATGCFEPSGGGDLDEAIIFPFYNGGDPLAATSSNAERLWVRVPYACTISSVEVTLDQSGSIVVDLWKDTYANWPPTDADSITASAPPTVSSATKSQDSTLTGWTTSIAAGDYIMANIDSASTALAAEVSIQCTRN